MTRTVTVVILDLDNTLYDWLGMWHAAFTAMLRVLIEETGLSEDVLLPEFKRVHEKYGTSEYSWSIQELPSLCQKYPGENLVEKFSRAINAYRDARNVNMKLYPNVLETLECLKDKGCLLIGYTESAEYYTARRVKKLGLDRVLDYLWSSPDSELPSGVTRQDLRSQPDDYYRLRRTLHYALPKGELKPNPKVLRDIIIRAGANPEETIYIGDNLFKDISMAQGAGVEDVWAKYGETKGRTEYELLKKVTQWTLADVEREKKLTPSTINPTHTLETDLGEILKIFVFGRFIEKSDERLKITVEIWKKTVEVQQHFNDLELRIRNYALTLLAAVLGLAGYVLKENLQVTMLHGDSVPAASVILLLSILPWLSFYFMDRAWYHRLLLGAVDNGTFIEGRWESVLPEISLSKKISKRSPFKIGNLIVHAGRKMDVFYLSIASLLLVLALLAAVIARSTPAEKSPDAPKFKLLQAGGTPIIPESDSRVAYPFEV